jgi:tetratricopeptide (TPR) repeat protein
VHASLRLLLPLVLSLTVPGFAAAQTGKDTPAPAPKARPEAGPKAGPHSDQKSEPQAKPADPKAAPGPQAAAPRGPHGSPLEKPPQTAEEKAKVLGDLYAHLATAETEEAAKKTAALIERLWAYSGSETVDLLMLRVGKAVAAKNLEAAQRFLDRVVALAPDYTEGFMRRAYVFLSQNNYEAGLGDLRRVLALDPSHYRAMEDLAQAWRETGNKKGALRVLRQGLDVHPFAANVKSTIEELQREVEGQGI